jgi:hypothetical protein
MVKTTTIEIQDYKDTSLGEAIHDLGMTQEEGSDVFEYGEFLNATIIVDENLNIIGGKINKFK